MLRIAAALAPTARVAHLGSAGLTVALAAIPAIVAVVRGDAVVSTPLVIACLVGGASVGWAVDDPAAEVLAPLPVSSTVRSTVRVLFAAVVAAVGVTLALLVIAFGPGLPPDARDRLPEATAAAAVALAVGFVAVRRGERGVGPIAVTAGVLGSAVVAALAYRWPDVLPTFASGPIHARWWILAGLAFAVAARAGRDPGL